MRLPIPEKAKAIPQEATKVELPKLEEVEVPKEEVHKKKKK